MWPFGVKGILSKALKKSYQHWSCSCESVIFRQHSICLQVESTCACFWANALLGTNIGWSSGSPLSRLVYIQGARTTKQSALAYTLFVMFIYLVGKRSVSDNNYWRELVLVSVGPSSKVVQTRMGTMGSTRIYVNLILPERFFGLFG